MNQSLKHHADNAEDNVAHSRRIEPHLSDAWHTRTHPQQLLDLDATDAIT